MSAIVVLITSVLWSAQPSSGGPSPVPTLSSWLDGVMGGLPDSACLSISVDGRPLYRRNASRALVPASNQKLLTATVARDVLGDEHRSTTRVLAGSKPNNGLLSGDLYLVGGGDPLLSTNVDRLVRHIGDDRHPTSLDELADRVVASGLKAITGRVVGDESRYDDLRSVPSWPERYARQGQSGPLSALSVDDGFTYELRPDQEPKRRRSREPALDAAGTFTTMLQSRGVLIGNFPAVGRAPAGAAELARIDSAPLASVLGELLTFSDNQTAELLLKEIGLRVRGSGSTNAGALATAERAAALGLTGPEAVVVDGSGLDPGNRATCDEFVRVLDASGPDGTIGRGLAVAGRTGTLRRRLDTPALAGRLRAKTGNLSGVTSLSGFVPTASGEIATFSMITNGVESAETVWKAQSAVAELVAAHVADCDGGPRRAPLVMVPDLYAASIGTVAMVPIDAVLLPGTTLSLRVGSAGYEHLVGRCWADDDDFGVIVASARNEG